MVGSIGCLHVLVQHDAETLYDTSVAGYGRSGLAGDRTLLSRLASTCGAGKSVLSYAAEPLRAESAYRRKNDGWDDLEWNGAGQLASAVDGAGYLSPWQPATGERLSVLLSEWAKLRTPPTALTLSLRLPRERIFGYSEKQRGAYIRDRARDPIDLRTPEEFAEWGLWREAKMTSLLKTLLDGYRAQRPGTRVTALGTAELPIMTPAERCAPADNWLDWLDQGLVQEVLLDTVWEPKTTGRIWGVLRQISLAQLQRTGKSSLGTAQNPVANLHPLIGYTVLEDGPTWQQQYATLKAEGAPLDSICYCPNTIKELDEILAFIKPR